LPTLDQRKNREMWSPSRDNAAKFLLQKEKQEKRRGAGRLRNLGEMKRKEGRSSGSGKIKASWGGSRTTAKTGGERGGV